MIDIDLRKVGQVSDAELRRIMKKENKEDMVREIGLIRQCPFCGSEISITRNDGEGCFFAYHKDENCFFDSDPIRIKGCDSYEEAVKEWNRQVKSVCI